MPNRLAHANSPYLLQHAENPVDWYPWGPEALEAAQRQQKPIFLSIGYAACHWCHVMAHESFEDPQIARLLNAEFISIKVDREERPDLDQIYMNAVQLISGRGGWPMSMFLTPAREPFFGGTYWPPHARGGMPGFDQVLRAVVETWRTRREDAVEQAQEIARLLRENRIEESHAAADLSQRPLQAAETSLRRSFDARWGGFSPAPKFPPSVNLRLLLRRWYRTGDENLLAMVRTTLDRMAAGGIYDQVGGGFHRYSVDGEWLVPHFEKMLYDNALLGLAYLEAWQVTADPEYARITRETVEYVLRDMTDAQGGFYSSEDADSEGEEGLFYLWRPDEVEAALGRETAQRFAAVYDVSEAGNFEGRNILHRSQTLEQAARMLALDPARLASELAEAREKLRAARSRRARPGRDDKVLVAWNGLMIDTLAQAGAALGRTEYVEAAARAADFLLTYVRADGRLQHYWRQGLASVDAYLDDYAALINGLVSLYQAQFDERWIEAAVLLTDQMLHRFGDREHGGFYFAGEEEHLLVRQKDVLDGSVPSSSGLATTALLRLGRLCGRDDFQETARQALEAHAALLERAPAACGQMLLALDTHFNPPVEIVILGSEDRRSTSEVLAQLHRYYVPDRVVAFRSAHRPPKESRGALARIFEDKRPLAPGPTVYICRDFACQPPITGRDQALAAWTELATVSGVVG
jgi:uncharacterized protein YyaL (SSP411 family)